MRASRYVQWLKRHASKVLIAATLLVAASAYLAAFHLPLKSDFSYLLPADAPAVRAAEELAQRVPARDRMLVIITAPDPTIRAAAARDAIAGLRAIGPELVEHVESDDQATRDLIRDHRHLFISLADLTTVRDALAEQIAAAKRRANPLFIDLEEEPANTHKLDELRAKQRHAQARLDQQRFISADGRSQVIVVHTAFRATDVGKDRELLSQLDRVSGGLYRYPFVTVGLAGGPPVTIAEQGALSRGILVSSLITLVLVSAVLYLHLRSVRMLGFLAGNIVAATLIAFGFATVTVGHLNSATAFLGAIIAGNGVNYGILFVARYLEERRNQDVEAALAAAVAGTLVPTLVASLGAAIAYGALGATAFRGFADFAMIGGVGMLVCWIASFVLLPVLIMRFARNLTRAPSPMFGRFVEGVFAFRRPAVALVAAGAVTLGAGVVAWRYLASDPYEYDLTQLRSHSQDAIRLRERLAFSDQTFGKGLAGLTGQTFLAVDREDQIDGVLAAARSLAARDPIVGEVVSARDVIPADQPAKLALLAEIRAQIDDVDPELEPAERDELLALRPPDGLRALELGDLPHDLRAKLVERDGRIGTVLAIKPGAKVDERDGHDLIRFAASVRSLERDGHVVASGAALLFADVLLQIQKDGPLITAIAAVGLIVMVFAVVGLTRRAVAVLVASIAGTILMIAASALAGLKINFLDFVALPITLGLGIDYAINVADRATRDDPMIALRSTGGTVLVCSLTTVFGYLSLLASDNLAIRGFGLASLLGEVTCVVAALVIVPALVAVSVNAVEPEFARLRCR